MRIRWKMPNTFFFFFFFYILPSVTPVILTNAQPLFLRLTHVRVLYPVIDTILSNPLFDKFSSLAGSCLNPWNIYSFIQRRSVIFRCQSILKLEEERMVQRARWDLECPCCLFKNFYFVNSIKYFFICFRII